MTTTGPALLRLTALQHTSPSPVLGPFTCPRGSACPLPHMRVREQLRFREVGEATVGCRAWTWSTSTDHTRFLLLASVKMFTNVYGAPTPCKGHCACRPQTGMIKSKPGPVGTPRVDSLRHDQQAGPQKPAWCLRRVWPPTHTHTPPSSSLPSPECSALGKSLGACLQGISRHQPMWVRPECGGSPSTVKGAEIGGMDCVFWRVLGIERDP